MGMDVFGLDPKSKRGEYFRRNVWGWRPLAELAVELCPEATSGCKYWQSNDGGGLDASGAARLADALQGKLDDGSAEAWIKVRDAAIRLMPNEACKLCRGSGCRTDAVAQRMGQEARCCAATTVVDDKTIPHPRAGQIGWCNGCDGRGWNRPDSASYHVDGDDVVDFIAFLRDSGGFKIC